MQHSKGFGIIAATVILAAAVLLIADSSHAATHGIPPLFREYPNARLSGEIRADDNHLNYRLPNETEPIHYEVELTTNVHSGQKDFKGNVKIELRVLVETSTIVLHARQLTIESATIKRKDIAGAVEEKLNFGYNITLEFLTLTPTNTNLKLPKDSIWILTIQYSGELRTDNGGFYLSTYADENGHVRNLATTQFESTDARHGFPCYDEPAKRANFTITINHDQTYRAISNMPVDTVKSKPGTTVFLTSNAMPTYLVAFIISDFKWNEGQLNSLPQSVYSRPGTENDQEWALVSGMLITERLAEYYGVNFTLPKLDQVAVPDFAAGAMENWGLVTYREEYLLYNKEKSTVNTQTNIASIIAHEYAHQWFGNLVAIRWWTYLWLKEGFATLFSYQAVDDAYPEWGYYQMFQVDDYQGALNNDASSSPRPMTHYVQQPNEISRLYDTVSYAKAGCVLHMWQNALTEPVFKRGLHNYLTINNHQSAEEWDLFEAIQIAAKELNYVLPGKIDDMMVTWTQQGGYPLLTVERHYNGSFTITQQAFFNNDTLSHEKLWYVPVNYATQTNSDFRNTEASAYLKKERSIRVSDPKLSKDDWLILNKQSTSYYRINYDERNWNLISNGLIAKTHKIHPRNRAQLMHDAYRFSSSNRLKHSILLTLMTYLRNEDQYAPWSTANSILTTFNRYLDGDSDYANFQYFVADLVTNIYERLGVNDIPGEQHFQKYTRSVVINLACLAGIDSCLKETNGKLKDLVESGIEIEPNLISQTYCNGLKQSTDKEFDYVYNQLMKSADQAQRRTLISSLGCAQNDRHIKKFVESSIDQTNELRTQERSTLLSAAYTRGEVGLLASIDFLDAHWEEYADLNAGFVGGNPLESDIRGISQRCNTPAHERRVLALVDKVKGSNKVSADLEDAVKSNIQVNFDWLAKNRVPIMSWVKGYRNGGVAVTASLLSMILAFLVSRLF